VIALCKFCRSLQKDAAVSAETDLIEFHAWNLTLSSIT